MGLVYALDRDASTVGGLQQILTYKELLEISET